MEICDPSVSLDLMFKSAFALGADQTRIGKFITSMSGVAAATHKADTNKRSASAKGASKKKPIAKKKRPARAAVA